MADDDPFADLGEKLKDEPGEEESEAKPESETSTTGTSSPEDQIERRDPISDTTFSCEAAKQRPFYAREDTIADFDSWLKYELERELSQRGYRNIVVREMTDALLRTVVEEGLVREVAERFELARESPSSVSDE